jgi:atypical dual specificity phosphatase
MIHYGMALKDTLGLVIQSRPAVCPNPGFLKQLQELDMKVHGTLSLEVESLPGKKEDRLALFVYV